MKAKDGYYEDGECDYFFHFFVLIVFKKRIKQVVELPPPAMG
jgi:hypothetical protein